MPNLSLPLRGSPAGCLSPPLTLRPWPVRCGPALNEDNKVSLFVQYIHLATGERETVILNKHGEQAHAASKVPN